MDVRGPDGKIVRFPDGTPAAKINQVMSSVYRAKPVSNRNKGTGVGPIDQTLSSINEAVIGAGEGLYNMASGVTDMALRPFLGRAAITQAKAQRQGVVDKLSDVFISRPSPVARTVGQIGATIPLGSIKAPSALAANAPRIAAVATRGVQGALAGLAVRDQKQDAGSSALLGAVANVILPPVLSSALGLGAKAARAIIPAAALATVKNVGTRVLGVADDLGERGYNALAPKIGRSSLPASRPIEQVAKEAAPAVASLGRDAAARAANFKAAGVREPTTAMVTRDPKAWTFERETAKSAEHGNELTNAFIKVSDDLDRSTQQLVRAKGGARGAEDVGTAARTALMPLRNSTASQVQAAETGLSSGAEDIVRSQGGALGAEATGANAQKVLDTKQSEMQAVTSRLYTNVREQQGEVPVGQLSKFREAIDDPEMTDNPVYDQMREGVMRRLNRFGMGGQSKLLRKDAVATVGQAEELRKFIGRLGDGKDPSVKRMRSILIDSLDDDVVGTLGDDAFKHARAAARAGFEEFKKTYAGKVAEGAVAPEKLTRSLMGQGSSLADVRQLKTSLSTGTPEQIGRGQDAWRKIGAQAADDLFNSARNADGRIVGDVLRKKFVAAAPKLREALGPQEYSNLVRLVSSTRDRTAETAYTAFKVTLPGRIAEGVIAPEKLVKNILGDGTTLAEIRVLRGALGSNEQGRTAWNGVAAQALDDLFANSRAGEVLSGARLGKNFAKSAPKLRLLLEPAEFKQLQRIVAAARDSHTAPAFSSVNHSNSASAIANMFAEPSPVGRSTIKNVLQHLGAFATMGPGGNVALAVGKGAMADRAATKAAENMALRIQMAKSPQEAAKVLATMRAKASRDAAFAAVVKRLQKLPRNAPGSIAATVVPQD